ncbi:hypothetical protein [Streptomyces sp. NPDC101455]|uniref:hypothetical protein n=1 Tax=Streptomyces sp. NPDC101455 TaxID=3366142 RepID=UPI00382D7DD7
MSRPSMVLVEPNAHRVSGHHHGALVALTRAVPGALVVALNGITAESRSMIEAAGCRITTRARGPAAVVLLAAAIGAAAVADLGLAVFASRRWPTRVRRVPHQVTALARCLAEAAAVRTARALAGPAAPVIVLSAGEALHGLAAVLGGPHARFVHEINTTEDLPLRLLGRAAQPGLSRALVLAPTEQVCGDLLARFPGLRCQVRPFAVADPAERLTSSERRAARAAFALADDQTAVCLIGGWWPSKDIAVLDAALGRLTRPLHLLVIGDPLDRAVLQRWQGLPHIRLHAFPGPASQARIRTVYAAADAAVVSRRMGVGKESGLVADAARLGVPLIVSDHDPALTQRLAGRDWARLFPAGDSGALAVLLDDLRAHPPSRPGSYAAADIGVPTAADQGAFLTGLHHL